MRLHEQYRLLQQHYGEQPVSPGVAELAALLARDGFASVTEAIGADL